MRTLGLTRIVGARWIGLAVVALIAAFWVHHAATASGRSGTAKFVQDGKKLRGSGDNELNSFGEDVAISADGRTALVGEPKNGANPGLAWIFYRHGHLWARAARPLRRPDGSAGAGFGGSVAISDDGRTALVGDTGGGDTGVAWVFTRSSRGWSRQAVGLQGGDIAIDSGRGGAGFGFSVALSASGNAAAVAAPEDTGGPGAVTMFSRSPSGWSQDGPKVMPLKTGGNFCVPGVTTGSPSSIALSGNGQVLAIGGPTWGDFKGCVWVFSRISSRWTQRAEFVCPPGSHGAYIYGGSIALTANGKTMLVGSSRDGVEGGEAWSYTQKHGSWNTAAKALDTKGVFDLGIQGLTEVSISADGRTALLGEMSFNSNVGAAWIFTRSGQKWHQSGKRMRPKDESGFAGQFAYSVALSDDGSTALIGGNNDNRVGAAWLFSRIR